MTLANDVTVATEDQISAGLSPAIVLTQQMLEMVQHQHWDALALLENQRRLFLENFFSNPLTLQDRQAIAADIHNILELDRKIIALAEIERQAAMDGIKQQEQARRADRAYTSAQRDPNE